jgi:hypothetical protein
MSDLTESRPVVAELLHGDRRTDGLTDVINLFGAFSRFVKADLKWLKSRWFANYLFIY